MGAWLSICRLDVAVFCALPCKSRAAGCLSDVKKKIRACTILISRWKLKKREIPRFSDAVNEPTIDQTVPFALKSKKSCRELQGEEQTEEILTNDPNAKLQLFISLSNMLCPVVSAAPSLVVEAEAGEFE